jgi:porphobilinogen deaminase
VLAKIGAGCHEPVGVYSEIKGEDIHISLLTVDEDNGQYSDSVGPCIHTRVVTGKINDIPSLIENLVKC